MNSELLKAFDEWWDKKIKESVLVLCCKCGKDITEDTQIGAGDGSGNLFQCEDCYTKKEKVKA